MGKLDGKTALVTGAARGIGREIALTLAREGADIAISDIRSPDAAAGEIQKLGRRVFARVTDVRKKAEVEQLVDEVIKQFGKIDILVNNAGILQRIPLLEMEEDDWDAVINTNLKGTFLCTRTVAPHMVKQKHGKIINLASIAGIYGAFSGAGVDYGVSKAGIAQFTRITARELASHGINVNAVAPGQVVTDISYISRTKEQAQQAIEANIKQIPMGRSGTPRDIANAALFLASEEASYVTGHVLVVDGGATA